MASLTRRLRALIDSGTGFTRRELIVLGLLGAGALAGGTLRHLQSGSSPKVQPPAFDYSRLDSIFTALSNDTTHPPPAEYPPERPDGPVDLNSADATTLMGLPGIGPALAGRIVRYREKNGPFRSVDGLLGVRGIGPKTFRKLRQMICVR